MMNYFRDNWKYLALLLVLGFALIFWQLGQPSLWQGDEGIYGEIAREMHDSGNFITPHYNYAPRFDKPPLYFWLTAISYKIFGINETIVRLWPALFGLSTVFLVFIMGSYLWHRKVGFIAALIMLTSFQNVIQSRTAMMDTALTFWLTLCVFFLLKWYRENNWGNFYLAAATSGVAVLVKGPVGLLFPLVVMLIALLISKDVKRLLDKRVLVSAGIFLVVSVPWYLAAYLANGAVFISDFFGYQNIARFTKAIEQHGAPWYFYILTLLVGLFPWCAFLPVLARDKGEHQDKDTKFLKTFFWAWIVFIFVFFSFSQSKLPGYIFPVFPMLSLLLGAKLSALLDTKAWQALSRAGRGLILSGIVLYSLLAIVFSGVIYYVVNNVSPSESPLLLSSFQPLFWLLAGSAILGLFTFFKPKLSLIVIIGVQVIFFAILLTTILPQTEKDKSINEIGRQLLQTMSAGQQIGQYKYVEPRAVFYSRHKIELLSDPESLKKYLSIPGRWVILDRADYLEMACTVLGDIHFKLE
ncbi:MAG: glycosyltransferase family 39 protein, partial [Candidatus Margulisiibacteriota bacterium]